MKKSNQKKNVVLFALKMMPANQPFMDPIEKSAFYMIRSLHLMSLKKQIQDII